METCDPELPPRLIVTSSGEADEEPLSWPRLTTISGAVDSLEALVLDALDAPPRLMTTSGTPDAPDEELLPWPTFETTSGTLDPLETLVLDAPPRLMTISGTPDAPDEELLPWTTFTTTSGVFDPLDALVLDVLDAPPR